VLGHLPRDWIAFGTNQIVVVPSKAVTPACRLRNRTSEVRNLWLTSVLAKIGQTSVDQLNQFLPDLWKAEDAAEPIATEAC
jgi:hypothetical protein